MNLEDLCLPPSTSRKWGILDVLPVPHPRSFFWVEMDTFTDVFRDESLFFGANVKFLESDQAPVVARFQSPSGVT